MTKQFSADTQVSLTEFESASEFIRNILNIKSSGKNVPNIKYRAKLHIFSISLRTQEYIYLHSDHSENLSGFWLWSLSNFFRQTWGLIFGSRCLSLTFSILKSITFSQKYQLFYFELDKTQATIAWGCWQCFKASSWCYGIRYEMLLSMLAEYLAAGFCGLPRGSTYITYQQVGQDVCLHHCQNQIFDK